MGSTFADYLDDSIVSQLSKLGINILNEGTDEGLEGCVSRAIYEITKDTLKTTKGSKGKSDNNRGRDTK